MNSISFGKIRIHDDPVCPAPPLVGAPNSEGDSLLLTEQFKVVGDVRDDLHAYSAAVSSEKGVNRLIKGVCARFLRDPDYFEQYIQTLNGAPDLIFELSDHFGPERLTDLDPVSAQDLIGPLRLTGAHNHFEYSSAISDRLERSACYLGHYSRESLEKWLALAVSGGECAKPAQDVLRGLFNSCWSVGENQLELEKIKQRMTKTLDFLYAFAEAVVATKDPIARDFGWRMLAFDTDLFDRDSTGFVHFSLGAFAPSDSDLQKFLEIESVISLLMPEGMAEVVDRFKMSRLETLERVEYQKLIPELHRQCPDRLRRLASYYDSDEELIVEQGVEPPWPDKLVVNGGPLRVALHNALASSDPSYAVYWTPGVEGLMLVKPAQLDPEQLQFKPSDDGIVSLPGQVRTLFYLTPELDIEAYQRLDSDLPTLRGEITHNMSHLISPRGDKMMVVDPELKALGFKWILFEQGTGLKTTGLTIAVGEYKFEFNLGKDLSLRDRHNNEPFEVPFQRNAFLEHVILSHLHDLMCTHDIVVNGDRGGIDSNPESALTFKGRRSHLRKLAPGKGFTPAQWTLAYNTEQELDLNRLNEERGLTRETGQLTFVSPSDPRLDYGPFVSSAPKSMARMKGLLSSTSPSTSTEEAGTQPEA